MARRFSQRPARGQAICSGEKVPSSKFQVPTHVNMRALDLRTWNLDSRQILQRGPESFSGAGSRAKSGRQNPAPEVVAYAVLSKAQMNVSLYQAAAAMNAH